VIREKETIWERHGGRREVQNIFDGEDIIPYLDSVLEGTNI